MSRWIFFIVSASLSGDFYCLETNASWSPGRNEKDSTESHGPVTHGIYIYIYIFFFFLVVPHGLWDLSSPARDWTWATAVKALSPNHWTTREFPTYGIFQGQSHPLPGGIQDTAHPPTGLPCTQEPVSSFLSNNQPRSALQLMRRLGQK